jgi:hypothetical protein
MNLVATSLSETYSIVGSCINCTTPANLLVTMALIVIGGALVFRSELRGSEIRQELSGTDLVKMH